MMAGCVKECTRAEDDLVLKALRLRDRGFDSGKISRRLGYSSSSYVRTIFQRVDQATREYGA